MALLHRYPWLLPLLSFASGWISFALMQRNERMARAIAALTLLGWLVLLAEELLGNWVYRLSRGHLDHRLVQLLTQSLQQQMLFFALPFLIGATQSDIGQIAFTALAIVAALACTIDPLYYPRIAGVAASSLLFHGFCSLLAGLVVLPLVLRLPLEKSLPLALGLASGLILLGLPRLLAAAAPRVAAWRMTTLALGLGLLWLGQQHIPAAGLKVTQAVITASVSDDLQPGAELQQIPVAQLHDGLSSFVAVQAPQGLAQAVSFEWRHNGALVDRIPGVIKGGREAGYRSYSRKQNFPADSQGDWRVDLRAASGQLICRMRFVVI